MTQMRGFLTRFHLVNALKRFPLASLAALGSAISFILAVKYDHVDPKLISQRLTLQGLGLFLGLPLFLSLHLIYEVIVSKGAKIISFTLAIVGLGAYVFHLATTPLSYFDHYQYIALQLTLILLVGLAPFLKKAASSESFWWFNVALFSRYIQGAFFAVVIFIGLALALSSSKLLFDIRVSEDMYLQLWVAITFGFHPLYFLSGIPPQPQNTAGTSYPLSLKVFAQYILLGLVLVYALILYTYSVKIILHWEWPRGYVSMLVSCYIVLGYLAYLLLFPLLQNTSNPRLRRTFQVFFVALIPLLALLAGAIYRRVSEYGLTDERYYLIILTAWALGITLYYLLSRAGSIKWIPLSLTLLLGLSLFGPWSHKNLSVTSQLHQLKAKLMALQLLDKGSFKAGEHLITPDDYDQLRSMLNFIATKQQLARVDFMPVAAIVDRSKSSSQLVDEIFTTLKLKQNYSAGSSADKHFDHPESHLINTRGYDYYLSFSDYIYSPKPQDEKKSLLVNEEGVQLSVTDAIWQIKTPQSQKTLDLSGFYAKVLKEATPSYNVEAALLTHYYEDSEVKLKIVFNRISFYSNQPLPQQYRGYLLIKFK